MTNKERIFHDYRFAPVMEKEKMLLLATAIDLLEEIRDLLQRELRYGKDDMK